MISCALAGQPGEAYNIASGQEISIADLAYKINEITGNKKGVELKPARNWDRSGRRFGSTKKSKDLLGFEATVSIDEGLQKTISWTSANLEIIRQEISKHDYFMQGIKI